MYPSGKENQGTNEVNFNQAKQNHTTKQKNSAFGSNLHTQTASNTLWTQCKLFSILQIVKLICKLIWGVWHLSAPLPDEKSLVQQ